MMCSIDYSRCEAKVQRNIKKWQSILHQCRELKMSDNVRTIVMGQIKHNRELAHKLGEKANEQVNSENTVL